MGGYIYLCLTKWTVDKDITTWSFPDTDDIHLSMQIRIYAFIAKEGKTLSSPTLI